MVQRIIIDTTATNADTRILKATTLEDLYDFGLADIVMTIITPNQWAVTTLGAVLQQINDQIAATYPNTSAVLDRHTLERFIRDMALNGYDIGFSDELPIGVRPLAATISNITPASNQVTIDAVVNVNDNVVKLWVYYTRQTGNDGEQVFDVAPDGSGNVQVVITPAPADTYTLRVAGINSSELRGFSSPESTPFVVPS